LRLLELTTELDGLTVNNSILAYGTNITGLTSDSREVRAGYLFAAFPGAKVDGREFIEQAIKKGAVAILAPEGAVIDNKNVVVIEDKNPRRSFAKMAGIFFGKQMDTIVAVTGTNGKSSTVNFCRQMWQSMEHAAASLGTIGIMANFANGGIINRPGTLTTPDPVTLHSEIAELEASGVTHLAIEASSDGLSQYRLDGVRVTAAGFTNLTRDHLNTHGTMENYFDAKLRLFRELLIPSGVAVINSDTPYSDAVRAACEKRDLRVIDYGRKARDIRLAKHHPLPDGQFLELIVFGERYELELPLIGEFQAENALCALGLVIAEDPDNRLLHMQGIYALEKLKSVRGRLEFAAKHPSGAPIYVDYAHTADGLETMLNALRPHTEKNLHVVFGAGGDRDPARRTQMGEVAARIADKIIVTDDNPRTEDPAAIRAAIMKVAPRAAEIAGRREAIRKAIRNLQAGDVLVIAGKGHEQGQDIGKEILPFDDVTEVKNAVLELK